MSATCASVSGVALGAIARRTAFCLIRCTTGIDRGLSPGDSPVRSASLEVLIPYSTFSCTALSGGANRPLDPASTFVVLAVLRRRIRRVRIRRVATCEVPLRVATFLFHQGADFFEKQRSQCTRRRQSCQRVQPPLINPQQPTNVGACSWIRSVGWRLDLPRQKRICRFVIRQLIMRRGFLLSTRRSATSCGQCGLVGCFFTCIQQRSWGSNPFAGLLLPSRRLDVSVVRWPACRSQAFPPDRFRRAHVSTCLRKFLCGLPGLIPPGQSANSPTRR